MKLFALALSTSFILGSAQAQTQDIASGKIAELTCHRVERLVTLKKIDETFLTGLHTIEVEPIPASAGFRAVASQYPGADRTMKQVEIVFDAQGKPLTHAVMPGSAAQGNPQWPDKDSVTLTENALHHLLDNWSTNPALKPFFTGFKNLALTQVKSAQGENLARIEIHSVETNSVLEILVKLDGTFLAANIKP